MEKAVPLQSQSRAIGMAQAGGRFDEGVEHRLKIEGRSADDFEDIRGRRLLLQRLAKFLRPKIELFLEFPALRVGFKPNMALQRCRLAASRLSRFAACS
jgi:hypothetical protein